MPPEDVGDRRKRREEDRRGEEVDGTNVAANMAVSRVEVRENV